MILHLGVLDVPYDQPKPRFSPKHLGVVSVTRTTGDVAEILEAKYHVMESFVEAHEEQIFDLIEGSFAGAIENLQIGGPTNLSPTAEAMSSIEDSFKRFLSTKEMDSLGNPGVPTKAAKRGVNHRLKHPYAKSNPSRPSFIDTGQYQASFKAWTD